MALSSDQIPLDISDPNGAWTGTGGWHGRAVSACRRFDFFALPWQTLRKRKRMTEDGTIRCIKCSGGRHVLRIEQPRRFGADLDRPLYAKCYSIDTWRQRIGNLFSGGKARREYRLGWALIERGLSTPVPLAWALAGPARLLGARPASNFLLSLELKNQGTLSFWAEKGPADRIPDFYAVLAKFMAAMHAAGFYHDDCLSKNFSISPDADFSSGDVLKMFQIFDIDHGRIYAGGVPLGPRVANLFQMIASLRDSGLPDRQRRHKFLRDYMAAAGIHFNDEKKVAGRIDQIARRKLNQALMG
ncbi:lipopolysaccharide kinase InaA family protein [bacterium]|nr:lipopolysaccharide kinase InaA family protein [bacterium]